MSAPLAVGTELPPLALPPISRTTLALYAGASGDHNPMHVDIDAARDAGHPDVFAHGMLSMAYLGRALTGWFPQEALREYTVRFVSVTPVHGEPTCRGTVAAIEPETGEPGTSEPEVRGRRARIELAVTLADGTETVRGTAVVALAPQDGEHR